MAAKCTHIAEHMKKVKPQTKGCEECTRGERAPFALLVVCFTNNVVVERAFGSRQWYLPKSAATHVLTSPADPVE